MSDPDQVRLALHLARDGVKGIMVQMAAGRGLRLVQSREMVTNQQSLNDIRGPGIAIVGSGSQFRVDFF